MNRLLTTALTTLSIFAFCSQAQAEGRPFQGMLLGRLTGVSTFSYEVHGQATHLGHGSANLGMRTTPDTFFRRLLDILRDFPIARSSAASLIAADGSALQGVIRYDTFDAESLTATAEITITGGTGRFAAAGGTIDVLLVFSGESLLECAVLLGGTIDY